MVFVHRAGCDHVALGWHGQPWRWLDEIDGHGAQGPEVSTTARTGRGYGVIGSHRQVRDNGLCFNIYVYVQSYNVK